MSDFDTLSEQIDRDSIAARMNILTGIVIAIFLIFLVVFWYLQVVRGPYYEMLAGENVFKEYPLIAPRGLILDQRNQIVAENRVSHNLFITPRLSKNLKQTLEFLSAVLHITPEEMQRVIRKEGSLQSHRPVLIFQDLALPQLAYISARKLEYPEIDIQAEQKRSYPYGHLFSHVLGYVGGITEEQHRENHFPGADKRDIVGQAGLERSYNNYLMGKDGHEKKVVNSFGAELQEFAPVLQAPKSGQVLRLGMDLNLQRAAEAAFLEKDKFGAVVAMDVKTGDVLAMYSRPDFDPNNFIPKISPAIWKELISDPKHPLQNRVIQNKFSPGSTFKIVMALAALQEKKINPSTRFHCSGGQYIYNRTFRCWKPGGHGSVDLYRAIMQSCDVYFYNLGMRLDIDVIAKYARLLGMGASTHVDLPNETRGLVPDRAWKQDVARDKWYPGETISVAIGQGPVLVTALQLTSLFATVARKGTIVQPHVVKEILDFNGKVLQQVKPRVQPVTGIDPEYYDLVNKALWGVVNDWGTGTKARIEGYDVCGKTGTVQVVGFNRGRGLSEKDKSKYGDHAWFISFAPHSDPRIAVGVFVEHGGHGSDAAAPVAKKLLETYFQDRKIGPFSPVKTKAVKPNKPVQSQPVVVTTAGAQQE